MLIKEIHRLSEPGKHDHAEHKTVCRVDGPYDTKFDLYLQASHEEDKPRWVHIGSFTGIEPGSFVEQEIEKYMSFKL